MPNNQKSNNNYRACSFCGRREDQVEFLIPSPTGAMICDNCIDACNQIIYDHDQMMSDSEELSLSTLPKPAEIKAMLDEYVIGQDAAKRCCPLPYTTTTSVFSISQRRQDAEERLLLSAPTMTSKYRRATSFFSDPRVWVRPILPRLLQKRLRFPSQ